MSFVNLTPHPIHIGSLDEAGKFQQLRTIPKSAQEARVEEVVVAQDKITFAYESKSYTISAKTIELKDIQNLPPKVEGTYLIVSMAVAKRAAELNLSRDDLVGPYSEKAFREGGRVVGVPGLVRYVFKPIEQSSLSFQEGLKEFKNIRNIGFQNMTFGGKTPLKAFEEYEASVEIPKETTAAALDSEATASEPIDDVPCYTLQLKDIKHLPALEEGTLLLTAMPVAQECTRGDVYSGDFSTVVRLEGTATSLFTGIVRYR